MLIVSEQIILHDDQLFLPEWVRAPLYLSNKERYFAALESHKHANGNIELVISAVDQTLWDDIWRIEIDTRDAPGNALVLFSLLEDRGVNILAAESSVNTFSNNHTTTIFMSAAEYSSRYDLTQADRLKKPYPQLPDLRAELIAYLGDQLAFRPDGAPALRVSHMRSYRKLSDDLRAGSRFILNRSGEILNNGYARITTRAKDHLAKAVGLDGLQYSPAVDTKDRLIRVIFYGGKEPKKYHIQLVVRSDQDSILKTIFEIVYKSRGNIVRNNIRPCPPHIAHRLVEPIFDRTLYLDELQYKTIDITFDFLSTPDVDSLLKKLDSELAKHESELPSILFVTKRSWRTHNSEA